MVNLTYCLDSKWRIIDWHSPDNSCDCREYEGRSLLDAISDPTLRQLFGIALERVVATRRPLELELRCDTPELRRDAYVRLTPSTVGFAVIDAENGTLRQFARPAVRSLEKGWMGRSIVRMCSWCKKIEAEKDRWMEVEQAQRIMEAFQADRPPTITHGLCRVCYEVLAREVGLPESRSLPEKWSGLAV